MPAYPPPRRMWRSKAACCSSFRTSPARLPNEKRDREQTDDRQQRTRHPDSAGGWTAVTGAGLVLCVLGLAVRAAGRRDPLVVPRR